MRVALVHDWLTVYGGAERVLLELQHCFPQAPIYTAVYTPESLPPEFSRLDVRTSFIQRMPGLAKRHRLGLPLMPLAFEAFDLSDYELVISSSHACAKGVITGPETRHISYIHTPLRYAWDLSHSYLQQELPRWQRPLAQPLLHYLRLWDQLSAQRIDTLLCNSRFVQRRIQKYYHREAQVLYPPVDVPSTPPLRNPQDFFLVAGRQVSYKRMDLVVETFTRLNWPLKVVGDGPEHQRLRQLAGPRTEFLGPVSRAELENLYQQARALVFAPLEDFGIMPVEAQAFGCPVIAFGRGGALETVIDGETGLFFEAQTPDSLQAALERFVACEADFKTERLHAHARRFAAEHFVSGLQQVCSATSGIC
ncbi:MAG: glycosyltransferase [Candidatus Sericytochromatia bacterium]|nr:glycosyltransferase [Candidatus Sericytochromatia bacterium]